MDATIIHTALEIITFVEFIVVSMFKLAEVTWNPWNVTIDDFCEVCFNKLDKLIFLAHIRKSVEGKTQWAYNVIMTYLGYLIGKKWLIYQNAFAVHQP